MGDKEFTSRLYGKDHFRHSVDKPELPEGFVRYHKANFSTYFGLPESEFRGKRVLETGCGPGKHAVVLALMGSDVTAVDLTPENVERGETLKAFYKLGNLSFHQHDLMLPFTIGAPYDLISAHNWMQHAKNPSVVFRNLVGVLREGGRIYLSLYHGGTFRFFITQIARSLLGQEHYDLMRHLIKFHFPTGFKSFNNPDDIYMENIFDDFFVPYCHTTNYDILISDAKDLGLEPIMPKPDLGDLSELDNIPLRIGFKKVGAANPEAQLRYSKPLDEFAISSAKREIQDSIRLATEVIDKIKAGANPYVICGFCLGLYRVRAETSSIGSSKAKHGTLQAYFQMCLDTSLKRLSFAYDAQKLYMP